MTTDMVQEHGGFPDRKSALRKLGRLAEQERIYRVGAIDFPQFRSGRKTNVWAGWRPRNLRHEVLLSVFLLLYAWEVVRGYLVDERHPDAEVRSGGSFAYVELDAGSHDKGSFSQRLTSYRDCQDTVLFVTASNPGMGIDSEVRRRTLMQWTRAEAVRWAKDSGREFEAIGTRIWFTTLELAGGNRYGEIWENIHGNKRAIKVGGNRGDNPSTR